MLKIDRQTSIQKQPVTIHSLYESYGGMLLGYIFEIVKDRKVADECLVKIFSDVALHFATMDWDNGSNWMKLQRFAKERLSTFMDNPTQIESSAAGIVKQASNEYFERLNDAQKTVFCNVYYKNKKIDEISIELNKQEDSIRKTLKEAFAIMRNDSEN
ncbi:hypothetical protein ACSBL2_23030 [Pedobacter sp. AW31-3R]|uniref:hypothetical protein n=1 Tax=Pedobacter sp. AW31-3R TaxID=3445781 RepID=UPI003FA0DB98